MTHRAPDERELRISHIIDAPREAVFRAWTDADEVRRWFGMGQYETRAEVDLRLGGSYRFAMILPQGGELQVTGSYRVIDVPNRLVYTWCWQGGGPDESESLVTVEFRDLGERTEVQLTHSGFATDEAATPYARGWERAFEELRRVFAAPHHT